MPRVARRILACFGTPSSQADRHESLLFPSNDVHFTVHENGYVSNNDDNMTALATVVSARHFWSAFRVPTFTIWSCLHSPSLAQRSAENALPRLNMSHLRWQIRDTTPCSITQSCGALMGRAGLSTTLLPCLLVLLSPAIFKARVLTIIDHFVTSESSISYCNVNVS